MRLALVSTVSAPVCQHSAGSVEAWTWLMARELKLLGHEITIFCCEGSTADAEVVVSLPGPYGAPGSYDDWQLCEWINLCRAVEQSGRFDLVHAQAYLWGIPLQKLARAPMIHTLHIVPDDNSARLWESAPSTCVTAISRHQWSAYPHLHPTAIIPHGVDVSQFSFRETPEDYVLFLGRFTSGKGPLQAINTARTLGLRLILAGPENPYFREKVKPLIDGKSIEYAGFVRGKEREKLLGGARALLYPIQYPEAFGLVLIEAMLCGTPVAAMRFGAVEEIIDEGVSGFSARNPAEFEKFVSLCFALDRKRIRTIAEQRYSAELMASGYARLYEQILARSLSGAIAADLK
jgi:glycosyltransferase involved in cell wall biosynthesis